MTRFTRTKRISLTKKINKLKRLANLKNISLILILLLALNSIGIDAAPGPTNRSNIAPTIDLNVTPVKKPVDIVIMTDYTGTKLSALNTQINALKAQFTAVNVDPVFHIVSDIKKIGVQNDQLYEFVRYGHFYYSVSGYRRFKDYGLEESYTPYTSDEFIEWERIQGLISQFSSLPVRDPKNISFVKSAEMRTDTASTDRVYHNITITCTNDVKTSGAVQEEKYYHSTGSSTHRIYNTSSDYRNRTFSLIREWAAIDTAWTIDSKISDVSYDIYSFDFSKLTSIPLRIGSDRHLIFLSDAVAKDYSKTFGNYFNFGELTDNIKTYIKNNSFSVYGVTPDKARHTTLYPDKVESIEPYNLFTIFHMENGDLLKLGNSVLAGQLDEADKVYPEILSSFTTSPAKKILSYSSNIYMLTNDGFLKTANLNTEFQTVDGLSDIKDIKLRGSQGLYVLTNGGQVYRYGNDGVIFAMQQGYGVIIDRMLPDHNMFLTSTGVPYGVFSFYDGEWTYDSLVRFRRHDRYYDDVAREWRYNWSYLGNVKNIEEYRAGGESGTIIHYTNDTVEQFQYFDTMREDDRYDNHHDYPSIQIDIEFPLIESNVASISSTNYGVILHKKDTTTRMISCDVESHLSYDDEDNRWYTYYTTIPYNTSRLIPLNNITPIYCDFRGRNFYKDSNNKLYMIVSENIKPLPTSENIIDMGVVGDEILKLFYYDNSMYFLYNDGRLRQMRYNASVITDTILYTDVKNVYPSELQLYILKNNGSVLATGNSHNGQLGRKISNNYRYFVDPFHNALTFDTTKTYYSLLDLFNEIPNNKFYPLGGYATALNAIYSMYSSYTGSGNMYVVLGDDIKYESAYDDYESDPEHSRKWSISHDPTYFDNSMGLSAYHNPTGFTTNPPVKLDKTGKYVINLKARDNPKADNRFDIYRLWSLGDQNLTVYIHRKPVPMQRVTITNNGNGTYTLSALDAVSYDLDHSVTRADKGIVAREWRWKEATSTIWITGQMNKTDCDPQKSYITQLRVKDVEGVWSDYNTITIDKNNPPVALFTIDKNLIKTSELLKVKDQSFPQSFSIMARWNWIVKKLNADGSVPSTNLQNAQFTTSNVGTGSLAGYDANVKTNYSANGVGTYRIYLRAKDSNGLWSDGGTDATANINNFYSQDITVDTPPAASFTVSNGVMKTTDLLKLTDTSTASTISSVIEWHWVVKKLNTDGSVPSANLQNAQFDTHNAGTGTLAGYDANVKTDYSSNGVGTYRIYLRVKNTNGMWSDGGTDASFTLASFFYRDIVVDSPPIASFTIANSPMGLTDIMKLRDTSVKTGVSAINRWHWIVKKLNSDGSVPPTNLQDSQYANSNAGTGVLAGYDSNVKTNYSTNGVGTYRIYLRVRNANGMWSDGGTDATANLAKCFSGDLVVKSLLEISNVKISGYWNHWRGQIDMFGKQLTTEPHRFLSLEKVKVSADVSGGADKVVIRFSPDLEAMQFTDAMGNVYNYSDQVGGVVSFPANSTITLNPAEVDNQVSWEYILPLAASTKDWENVRKRPAYTMTIVAWKGTTSVTAEITDIELTGNTYDLIHMQPK